MKHAIFPNAASANAHAEKINRELYPAPVTGRLVNPGRQVWDTLPATTKWCEPVKHPTSNAHAVVLPDVEHVKHLPQGKQKGLLEPSNATIVDALPEDWTPVE